MTAEQRNDADGPTNPGGDTVSVTDGRRRHALDVCHCEGPWPTVTAGKECISASQHPIHTRPLRSSPGEGATAHNLSLDET